MKKNRLISTKEALIDLYLYFKDNYDKETNKKIEEEKEKIKILDEISIIKYIKDSIDIVISMIVEKKVNDYNNKLLNENTQQDYESILIKYEKDIRSHIKTEHQLKLYVESLQNNIEELEKEKNEYLYDNKDYREIIKKKNNEINKLTKEINNNNTIIEEKNKKIIENERKFKKIENDYKNEIEKLIKKIKYYENLLIEDGIEKDIKNNTIYCKSSRLPIKSNSNTNSINNYLESANKNNKFINNTYRNMNNIYIGNSYSNSISNSHPYEKKEKYISNKYCKINSNNKIKNIKGSSAENSLEKKINNNVSANSYIIDFKIQNESINKFITNNSSLNVNNTTNNNISKKTKKIYNRHKSIENNVNKYIKNKPLGIIKKILISSNNNSNIISNSNSIKNINKEKIKQINNNYINVKKLINSHNTSINTSNNFINKTNNGIIFNGNITNNNIENKNNNGNINIYSNGIKQNNSNNIYMGNNLKKTTENNISKELISNNINKVLLKNNYIKNNINYRNRQKEKMNSTYTNN